jgi:hypothetical protein
VLAPCFGTGAIRTRSDLLNHRPAGNEVLEHFNSSDETNSNYELCDAGVRSVGCLKDRFRAQPNRTVSL